MIYCENIFWNVFHKNFSHLREEMGRFRKRNEPKYKLLYILLVTNIVMSPTALTPRLVWPFVDQ